jgi:hypothetical protein
MRKIKKIAWESWNSKIEEITTHDEAQESDDDIESEGLPSLFFPVDVGGPAVIYTPMGPYPEESMLKPSDRWDCWIGHTNFDVTYSIVDIIEQTEGIEALSVLGRYSFFIGVAPLFDIKSVRSDIEQQLCEYTEEEILSDTEISETVNLVKKQLQSVDYWSILVAPGGEVEYVASNKMDKSYLDGLNELMILKNKIGGIILRGNNG